MRFYHGLISGGCRDDYDEETNRRIVVVNLFALLGMSITLALGARALFNDDYTLGTVLLISAFLFALCKGLLLHSKLRFSHVITPILLVICLMSLMIFLIIGGGVANTGPLWIYVLPPVAMFFAGVVFGVITMAVFTLICAVILFYPGEVLLMTSYPHEFKIRLLLSFATVTFLSAFYEHSRQTSFRIIRDISEKFEKQALNDTLTDLPNRRGVQQFMDFEIGRAKRQSAALSIVLCDIDRFKKVNDKYGHDAGDLALQHVAKLFTSSIRHQDVVSRWGGEEFLFVLPSTDESSGEHLAEKIRQSLAQTPVQLEKEQLTITASFGVAQLNPDIGLDKALSQADKALYRAKENGRNQVVTASSLESKA